MNQLKIQKTVDAYEGLNSFQRQVKYFTERHENRKKVVASEIPTGEVESLKNWKEEKGE